MARPIPIFVEEVVDDNGWEVDFEFHSFKGRFNPPRAPDDDFGLFWLTIRMSFGGVHIPMDAKGVDTLIERLQEWKVRVANGERSKDGE